MLSDCEPLVSFTILACKKAYLYTSVLAGIGGYDWGVSNAAKLSTWLCNLYNFTKITLGLHEVCTGITHICNIRIGYILVFRVIIRLKVQLG